MTLNDMLIVRERQDEKGRRGNGWEARTNEKYIR